MKQNQENWQKGPVKITAQTKVTPYLLRMKWKGHPLHHHHKLGWGYIISPDLPIGEAPKLDSTTDLEVRLVIGMDPFPPFHNSNRHL